MPKPTFAEGRAFKVSPKRYSPSYTLVAGSAESSSLVSLMVDRLHARNKGQQKVELADWESEGGSVADAVLTTP